MSWIHQKRTPPQEGNNQDEEHHHLIIPFFPTHPLSLHGSQGGPYHQEQSGDEICSGSKGPQLLVAPVLPTPFCHEQETSWAMKKIIRKRRKNPQDPQEKSRGSCSSPREILIRVCADCQTTKTPLWRSGPQGPRSVCNACGIRRRKARKAMATAAAAAKSEATCSTNHSTSGFVGSDPKLESYRHNHADANVPIKKRYIDLSPNIHDDHNKKGSAKDSNLSSALHTNHKAFPQDEKDAANLLMALSCGVICL